MASCGVPIKFPCSSRAGAPCSSRGVFVGVAMRFWRGCRGVGLHSCGSRGRWGSRTFAPTLTVPICFLPSSFWFPESNLWGPVSLAKIFKIHDFFFRMSPPLPSPPLPSPSSPLPLPFPSPPLPSPPLFPLVSCFAAA